MCFILQLPACVTTMPCLRQHLPPPLDSVQSSPKHRGLGLGCCFLPGFEHGRNGTRKAFLCRCCPTGTLKSKPRRDSSRPARTTLQPQGVGSARVPPAPAVLQQQPGPSWCIQLQKGEPVVYEKPSGGMKPVASARPRQKAVPLEVAL